jgi:hypothetical protein
MISISRLYGVQNKFKADTKQQVNLLYGFSLQYYLQVFVYQTEDNRSWGE